MQYMALQSHNIKIILFSADWCTSCKIIEPTFKSLQDMYSSCASFLYIDMDDNHNDTLCNTFSVNKIPLVIVVKNDEEINRHIGTDLQHLRRIIIDACDEDSTSTFTSV